VNIPEAKHFSLMMACTGGCRVTDAGVFDLLLARGNEAFGYRGRHFVQCTRGFLELAARRGLLSLS
jgi:hypothetical protein